MKIIGLIGGMSWESSAAYYRLINEKVKKELGGYHNARSLMYSVDFAQIEELQAQGDWDAMGKIMLDAGERLERGGSDFILICTNTMHKLAPEIERQLSIPLLHIADATAERIKGMGIKTVGLLGTKFTMEEDFYKQRLEDKHGINVIIPAIEERDVVHDIIYSQLVLGNFTAHSREIYNNIIENLPKRVLRGLF